MGREQKGRGRPPFDLFCSRSIFRASRMRKLHPSRGPIFRSARTGRLATQKNSACDILSAQVTFFANWKQRSFSKKTAGFVLDFYPHPRPTTVTLRSPNSSVMRFSDPFAHLTCRSPKTTRLLSCYLSNYFAKVTHLSSAIRNAKTLN